MPYAHGLKPKKPLNMPSSLPGLGFKDKTLKHVVFKMLLDSSAEHRHHQTTNSTKSEKTTVLNSSKSDLTAIFSDELLLRIFSKLPNSQRNSNSLVFKRWLNLHGCLVHSVKLLEWDFVMVTKPFDQEGHMHHVMWQQMVMGWLQIYNHMIIITD
ncbi:hypothetical protein NE237_028314 [Protea cynaroides]|uniref:F-box domain-containing protein n=1 Tax=Protea cynaroides TaxID=273540 RepID=A0A9Q0JTY1_9MAGN|nr:hypothetical protein NE237_028314 [Protea cynaroides]